MARYKRSRRLPHTTNCELSKKCVPCGGKNLKLCKKYQKNLFFTVDSFSTRMRGFYLLNNFSSYQSLFARYLALKIGNIENQTNRGSAFFQYFFSKSKIPKSPSTNPKLLFQLHFSLETIFSILKPRGGFWGAKIPTSETVFKTHRHRPPKMWVKNVKNQNFHPPPEMTIQSPKTFIRMNFFQLRPVSQLQSLKVKFRRKM